MIRKLLRMNDDAHEFKPILAEIETRPISPAGHYFFWLLILIFLLSGAWLYFGKVDIVVSARGKILPDGEIKVIQSLNTGVLNKILCRPGDYVHQGDVLLEIDPSTTAPAVASAVKNMRHLTLECMRLKALLSNTEFEPDPEGLEAAAIKIQKDIYQSTKMAFKSLVLSKQQELNMLEVQRLALKNEKVTTKALLEASTERIHRLEKVKDIISLDLYEREKENMLKHVHALDNIESKFRELGHSKRKLLDEIELEKQKHQNAILKELAEKKRQIGELEEEIARTQFMNQKQKIQATINGFINELYVHTVGGVVTPAQKLLSIVPDKTPLIIEAQVLNQDIGFVDVGMPVSVKIDTFNFQKYGMIDGKVMQISKDSIKDEKFGPVYKIYVRPQKTWLNVEGRRTEVNSGMTVTSEINVGKRRIIEFFVYPLVKYLDEGMSVR